MSGPSEAKPSPKVALRRKRRWIRRLAWSVLVLIALLAGTLGLIWYQRVALANHMLRSIMAPYQISVRKLDANWLTGKIELDDFVLRAPGKDGIKIVEVPRIEISTSISEMIEGRLRVVSLEQPHVLVNKELVEYFRDQPAKPSSMNTYQVDQIVMKQGRLEMVAPSLPTGAAVFDYRGGMVRLPANGLPTALAQDLSFSELNVAFEGSSMDLSGAAVDFDFDGSKEKLTIWQVKLPSGSANITIPTIYSKLAAPKNNEASSADKPMKFPEVSIVEINMEPFQISLKGEGLPDASFTVSWIGDRFYFGDKMTAGTQDITLSDISIGKPGDPDAKVLSLDTLELLFHADESEKLLVVDRLAANGLNLDLVPDAIAWLLANEDARAASSVGGSDHKDLPPILIKEAAIQSEGISIMGFADHTQLPLPNLETAGDINLKNLMLGPNGVTSPDSQRLVLAGLEAKFPGEDPFVTLASLELSVVPDEFAARREVALLKIEKPKIHMTGGLLERYAAQPAAAQGDSPAAGDPKTDEFPIEGLFAKTLSIVDGEIDLSDLGSGIPDAETTIDISTFDNTSIYQVLVRNTELLSPGTAKAPFAKVEEIEARIDPVNAWKDSLIDFISIKGAGLTVGKDLESLQAAQATSGGEAAAVASDASGRKWKVGVIQVEDSSVRIEKLGDDPKWASLDPIEIKLKIPPMKNMVLTEDALRQREELQKVEIALLELKTKWRGSGVTPIAEFKNIFIRYSVAGLMEKRIHEVKILNPIIHVDMKLFDFFSDEGEAEKPAPTADQLPDLRTLFASTNRFDPLASLAAKTVAIEPEVPVKGWAIDMIEAPFGILEIDLSGSALELLLSLPFECRTPLDLGAREGGVNFNLNFEVPEKTHKFTTPVRMEMDVVKKGKGTGETGGRFNYKSDEKGDPQKQKEVNFVQTTNASEVRIWPLGGKAGEQPLKIRNFWVTFTYKPENKEENKKAFVWGKFGGELYGGEFEGEVFLPVGEDGEMEPHRKWTVDINGFGSRELATKGINLQPIVKVLAPGIVDISGSVTFEVHAKGEGKSLEKLTGKFGTTTPGMMAIEKVDGLIADIPKDWPKFDTSLAKISLTALRDFPFDLCAANFEYGGNKGTMTFKLAGPMGKRNFKINYFDERESPTQ